MDDEQKEKTYIIDGVEITKTTAKSNILDAEDKVREVQELLKKARAILRLIEEFEESPEEDNIYNIKYTEIDKLHENDYPLRGVDDLIKKVVVVVKEGQETVISDIKGLSRGDKRQILRKIKKYCEYSNDSDEENTRIIYITKIKRELTLDNLDKLDAKDIDERELDRLINIQEKKKRLSELIKR